MSFIYADGTIQNLVPGSVVTILESALTRIGTSNFPYTPNNRWLFVHEDKTVNYHGVVITPTKETLEAIGGKLEALHTDEFINAQAIVRVASNGSISSKDARYYYVNPADIVPTCDVLSLDEDTCGKLPRICYYCGNTHYDCPEIDGRFICPDCISAHTFICSHCGERHDIRRRMRGSLNLCKPCYDDNPTLYVRAEDNGNVYRVDELVKVFNFHNDIIEYVTASYAEVNTFVCSACGNRHYTGRRITVYGKSYCRECADVKYPVCDHCHRRHIASNTKFIDNRHVCKACEARYYITCDVCGELHHINTMMRTEDTNRLVCSNCSESMSKCSICGKLRETPYESIVYEPAYGGRIKSGCVCPSCIENMVPCADCGVYISKRYSRVARDGKRYCSVCVNNHFFTCHRCGQLVAIDDGHGFHGDGDNRICDRCFTTSEHGLSGLESGDIVGWDAPHGIRDYGYKPNPVLFPAKDDVGIYYGIELETERHTDGEDRNNVANKVNRMLGFTYAKRDGSLGWDGIEFVSHPATIKYYLDNKQKFADAMKYLRSEGYQSHSGGSCGLHVHVSSFPLIYETENGVEKIIYMWDKFWEPLAKCSRRGITDGGRWASRIRCDLNNVHGGTAEEIESLKDTKKNSKNHGRYQAINLQNSHTIEFRLMRGTLNIDTFIASLQLISSIVEIAMKKSYEEIKAMTFDDVLAFHNYAELSEYWEAHKNNSINACGALFGDDDNFSIDIDDDSTLIAA